MNCFRNLNLVLCGVISLGASFGFAASTPYEGYTLIGSGTTAKLLDQSGSTVHTWNATQGTLQTPARLLPNGSVLFPLGASGRGGTSSVCSGAYGGDGAHANGYYEVVDKDNNVTWSYSYCSSTYVGNYDAEIIPNGNLLIPVEVKGGNGMIVEVQPSGATGGEVVWSYTLPAELEASRTYINSVSYNSELDKILISLQTPMKTIAVIDHSGTGSLYFSYSTGFTDRIHGAAWATDRYIGSDQVIPDADRTAMRANNLLVVSNQEGAAVEVNMITKQRIAIPFNYTQHQGSVQRLPNGNTLVNAAGSTTYEIDDTGKTIWSISHSSTDRAYKYGIYYSGVTALGLGEVYTKANINPNAGWSLKYGRSENQVQMKIPNTQGVDASIQVISLDGKQVYNSASSLENVTLDASSWVPATYIVQVKVGDKQFQGQFAKLP